MRIQNSKHVFEKYDSTQTHVHEASINYETHTHIRHVYFRHTSKCCPPPGRIRAPAKQSKSNSHPSNFHLLDAVAAAAPLTIVRFQFPFQKQRTRIQLITHTSYMYLLHATTLRKIAPLSRASFIKYTRETLSSTHAPLELQSSRAKSALCSFFCSGSRDRKSYHYDFQCAHVT